MDFRKEKQFVMEKGDLEDYINKLKELEKELIFGKEEFVVSSDEEEILLNEDKVIRKLSFKIIVEKFNEKYKIGING